MPYLSNSYKYLASAVFKKHSSLTFNWTDQSDYWLISTFVSLKLDKNINSNLFTLPIISLVNISYPVESGVIGAGFMWGFGLRVVRPLNGPSVALDFGAAVLRLVCRDLIFFVKLRMFLDKDRVPSGVVVFWSGGTFELRWQVVDSDVGFRQWTVIAARTTQ